MVLKYEPKVSEVTIKELGKVRLKELSGVGFVEIYDRYASMNGQSTEGKAAYELYIELLSKTVIDERGALVHDSEQGKAELAELPWRLLTQLGQEALELNGLIEKKQPGS